MFLVVFRNRKRTDMDAAAYAADADEMEDLASVQPGYRSFKSYTADDGEVVAISEWDDEGPRPIYFYTFAVPEPGTMSLAICGAGVVAALLSRKRKRSRASGNGKNS